MASKRITKGIANIVAAKLVRAATNDFLLEAARKEAVLFEELRVALIGKEHVEAFDKLPDHLKKMGGGIYTATGEILKNYGPKSIHATVYPSGPHATVLKTGIPVDASLTAFILDKVEHADLNNRLTKHVGEVNKAQQEAMTMYSTAVETIKNIGTVLKLKTEWPEAYDMLPNYALPSSASTALSVPINDIMTKLNNFPSGAEAA